MIFLQAEALFWESTVMIVVMAVFGFLAGIFLIRRKLGPAGLVFWLAKRKRTPVLLHEGRDGILRFWNALRSFGGNWRVGRNKEMTVIPESKSVYSMTQGPPFGLASANGIATLPFKFLYYADKFVTHFKQGPQRMTPVQVAEYIQQLRYREAEIRNILATITKIQNNEISIEEAVTELMQERGYDPKDEATRRKLESAFKGALETQGESYKRELQRVLKEKVIFVKEGGWKIAWEKIKQGKNIKWVIKYLYTSIPVTLTNYIAFMPGATIDDLTAALLEAEVAARLERTEDRGQTFKWLTLGIVIFLIMLGIYVVMQQLKVV